MRHHDNDRQIDEILKNSRNRQTVKRLARGGDFAFRHLEDPDEIRQHLPEFFRQHIQRWALAGYESQFLRPDQRSFYENLLEELGPEIIKFSVLESKGRPIAYHLGFETHGKYIFYKPTFDVDFWDHSPGTVLLIKLIDYIKHYDITELDFATGGEWYKSRFSNFSRDNYKIIMHRSNIDAARANIFFGSKKLANQLASGRPWAASIISKGNELRHMFLSKGTILRLRNRIKRHVIATERELYMVEASSYAAAVVCIPRVDEPIKIRSGSLKDLADLAVRALRNWDAVRLHDARMRLKRGDRLLIVERRGELEQLAWLAASSDLLSCLPALPNRTAGCKQPPPVLYEYRIFTRSGDTNLSAIGFRELIRGLLEEFSGILVYLERDVSHSIKIHEAGCVRIRSPHKAP
jgi:hypothetical protein